MSVLYGDDSIRHRLNGHAAEISFFALLSLIPVTVTIGAALKLVSQIMGPNVADQGQIDIARRVDRRGLGREVGFLQHADVERVERTDAIFLARDIAHRCRDDRISGLPAGEMRTQIIACARGYAQHHRQDC